MPTPPPLPDDALGALPTGVLIERAFDEPELRHACMVILRDREEAKAQAAAALLCFDLARNGDETAQAELALLRPTLDALRADADAADELLADPPALEGLWEAAQEVLDRADPRDYAPLIREEVDGSRELALLDDSDAPGDDVLGHAAEEARIRAEEMRRLLADNLDVDPAGRRVVRLGAGLKLATTADVDRVEAFLREVDARAGLVPVARGLSCLGHLFVGTHLRRQNVFGALNPRRAAAVRRGLEGLGTDLESMLEAAAFFAFEGESEAGFTKVLELLLDYLTFCDERGVLPQSAEARAEYVEAGRLPARVLGDEDERRRR